MSIIRDSISNFMGGVSQQADKIIMPNQSKLLENQLLDVVEGLKKRPPSKNIARLRNTLSVHPYIHTMIKEDKAYQIILDGSSCYVYDLAGVQQTITIEEDVLPYITTSKPLEDLYAITLADYTFILNKTKQVKFKSDTYPNAYPYSALIFVKQGNYATDYKITINGTVAASITTSEVTASDIKTTTIASNLVTQLTTNLGADWTVTSQGSSIFVSIN